MLYTIPMSINDYVPFFINKLDAIVRKVNMLIKEDTASSGLASSRRWRVLYFVNVIKISISFPLVISLSVTFSSITTQKYLTHFKLHLF